MGNNNVANGKAQNTLPCRCIIVRPNHRWRQVSAPVTDLSTLRVNISSVSKPVINKDVKTSFELTMWYGTFGSTMWSAPDLACQKSTWLRRLEIIVVKAFSHVVHVLIKNSSHHRIAISFLHFYHQTHPTWVSIRYSWLHQLSYAWFIQDCGPANFYEAKWRRFPSTCGREFSDKSHVTRYTRYLWPWGYVLHSRIPGIIVSYIKTEKNNSYRTGVVQTSGHRIVLILTSSSGSVRTSSRIQQQTNQDESIEIARTIIQTTFASIAAELWYLVVSDG
jgi:hypothetical protein